MKKQMLIFTPTVNEHEAVKRHLGQVSFNHFETKTFLTGPGKVNVAVSLMTEALTLQQQGLQTDFVVGVGTSGSLSKNLRSGDVIVSNGAVVSDWQMVDDHKICHAPYGELCYEEIGQSNLNKITFECTQPLIGQFINSLDSSEFKKGNMLCSDTFVAGLNHKLKSGEKFQCQACDMESGVLAYLAQNKLGNLPWFNVRVVADTLADNFDDYVTMEVNMVEILGGKLVKALKTLDALLA